MQISAATLLASQQQVPRAQPAQAEFAPIAFKQAAKPAQPASASEPPPPVSQPKQPTGTGPVRPGTHVDIKV
jgi:hypothetical protein